MRNKRLAGLIIGVFIGLLGWSAPASAHVQTANNGVSAVMHILPEDNPRAGEGTYIQFAFGGSAETFDAAVCDCELEVRDAAGVSSTTPVEPVDTSSTTSQVKVVFPRAGVYDLTLRGNADRNAQKRFAVVYVVRVSPGGAAGNKAGGLDVILVSLASLMCVGVIAYYIISSGTRYTNSPETAKLTR
jgi:hypothetical protein